MRVPSGTRVAYVRRLHAVLGVLCLAFVALIVLGNTVLHTAPGGLGYFKRGDVAAMLGLATVLAAVLFWASAGDTDRRRAIGSIASGAMTGLLLGTVSIPVVAVPLSVVGCLRLPASRAARIALLLLVPVGVVFGLALPYAGRSLTASSDSVPTLSRQTIRPISTAAATFSVPATFAVACGTMSDGVQTTRASATFFLNAPGRSPLKIASTGPGPIDAMVPSGTAQSGYVCLLLDAGVPLPVFAGLSGPQMPGYVVNGTTPATSARPAPTDFVLPQACAYVSPPVVGADSTVWAVDCGAQANHNARGTLGPALTQQGWTSCSVGLGYMWVKKNGVMLGVTESSLVRGEYPQVTQFAQLISPCK